MKRGWGDDLAETEQNPDRPHPGEIANPTWGMGPQNDGRTLVPYSQ